MIIEDKTNALFKIKRSAFKKNIHTLFIFNKSGICLYSRNFTTSYEIESKQIISSFFTALMSFTRELLKNEVKIIEMTDVKLVVFEKNTFYYGFLTEATENIIFLDEIASKINSQFINYISKNNIDIDMEYIHDEKFDLEIDDLIKDTLSTEFDLIKEEKIIDFLNEISLNTEIKGIILLTDKGRVIYSTLKGIDLRNFSKEVDFRVKICNNSILKLFYTSKNNELIFSDYIADLYLVILVFHTRTKFGVAEYYLQKVVNFIKKTLSY